MDTQRLLFSNTQSRSVCRKLVGGYVIFAFVVYYVIVGDSGTMNEQTILLVSLFGLATLLVPILLGGYRGGAVLCFIIGLVPGLMFFSLGVVSPETAQHTFLEVLGLFIGAILPGIIFVFILFLLGFGGRMVISNLTG